MKIFLNECLSYGKRYEGQLQIILMGLHELKKILHPTWSINVQAWVQSWVQNIKSIWGVLWTPTTLDQSYLNVTLPQVCKFASHDPKPTPPSMRSLCLRTIKGIPLRGWRSEVFVSNGYTNLRCTSSNRLGQTTCTNDWVGGQEGPSLMVDKHVNLP